MGGQLSYNVNPDVAVPGQLADENLDSRIVSFVAGEAIPFGRLCEADASGNLFLVKGSGANLTSGKLAGVSVLDVAREQQLATVGGSAGSGFYAQSEVVPVMRKGRIFGAWDGSGSQAVLTQPNVNHPTTGAAVTDGLRGVFTGSATNTAAGTEIAQAPAEILMVRDVSALTPARGGSAPNAWTFVALIELNLPGA